MSEHQSPGTSSPKWNAAFINVINSICAFFCFDKSNVCHVKCLQRPEMVTLSSIVGYSNWSRHQFGLVRAFSVKRLPAMGLKAPVWMNSKPKLTLKLSKLERSCRYRWLSQWTPFTLSHLIHRYHKHIDYNHFKSAVQLFFRSSTSNTADIFTIMYCYTGQISQSLFSGACLRIIRPCDVYCSCIT